MSKNTFYADLDRINKKGVLITGHGKGLVSKNSNINGEYIANDMVRLTIKNGELFGYQGYVEKEDNELTKIEYLLYFFDQTEPNQPPAPAIINAETYSSLSKHNINVGEKNALMISSLLGKTPPNLGSAYSEYEEILKQVNNANFISVPFTKDENERALFVNTLIK
ncbi:hypothetical protein CN488_23270 [Bacillus anthracis]|nr:hypothetical protein CN488_23270 [Bacillus anthracis]PGR15195.1 hypothetical protein COC50_29055 [Bacillus anthracis]